jgi:6-phosphogluconolactonase
MVIMQSLAKNRNTGKMKINGLAMLLLLPALAGCGGGLQPLTSTNASVPVLFFYVVGQDAQSVFGFQQNSGEAISSTNPSSAGTTLQPASVVVHPSGNFLYVANFGSNDVTSYSRNVTTGVVTPLGTVPPVATGTGPIAMATDSAGQFLFVLNQAPTQPEGSISVFSINTTRGLLTEIAGSPFPVGATPSAFAVSQSSSFIYVANGPASSISAFTFNSSGAISPVAGSPFASTGAAIPNLNTVAIDPKGRFVYATDSANNAVAGFAIQPSGALTLLSGSPFTLDASNPLGLTIDATGSFLYVGDTQINLFSSGTTGTVSALTISSSGSLAFILGSPFLTANGTTASGFVTIDPTNSFLYNSNPNNSSITASSINATTGALTQIGGGTPLGVGTNVSWIAVSAAQDEP